MYDHTFTTEIRKILAEDFGAAGEEIFESSYLLQYLNIKTRSAGRGSKSRSAFGNHYAVYVLIEDYLNRGFHQSAVSYSKAEGARFGDLFRRMRELPFGAKLQNHALNHRLNEEFHKYFPTVEYLPVLRDTKTSRYWINENLLLIRTGRRRYNIAASIVRIIDAYISAKRDSFEAFIEQCRQIQKLDDERSKTSDDHLEDARAFVAGLLALNVDARIFEIVSFAILKAFYGSSTVFWGWTRDKLNEEHLILYKTGRANANDGGIDFVMRPLGRFFQVTETLDVKKYFLDIDKVQRYPLTFVIKSNDEPNVVRSAIEQQARRIYGVEVIVARYLECVEEIINIAELLKRFDEVVNGGKLREVIDEIVTQSRVEFNIEEGDDEIHGYASES